MQHCERCYLSFMCEYHLCKLHAQKFRLLGPAIQFSIMLGINSILKAFVSVLTACKSYWVLPDMPHLVQKYKKPFFPPI